MRRLILLLVSSLLVCSILVSPGCKRRKKRAAAEEQLTGPASVVHTADPRTASQLVRGFHTVEQNAWRWTMGSFAVILLPPAGAAQKGATLQFKFSVPEAVITRLGTVTLSASVNGAALPPETYAKAGEAAYTRDVPASALAGSSATVEFKLDKFLEPSGADVRELGVVASTIGLEAKP